MGAVWARCNKVSQDPCQDLSFQLAGAPPQRASHIIVDLIKTLGHVFSRICSISDIMGDPFFFPSGSFVWFRLSAALF